MATPPPSPSQSPSQSPAASRARKPRPGGPFPRLDGSPYAVPSTARTQRWWFSNGIWLDQQQSGDVVGFCWTHWLADRGVQVSDGELGPDYAVTLQREAQELEGGQVGPEYGGRIDAAARVLQSRGLIEECYSFRTADDAVRALLERGQVVAGINWQREMFDTVVVDGWSVCRYAPGGTVAGGHAILLNGVALDLTLDGVTGFVRFKNTWGQAWADQGQALVSIADLTAVIDLETTVLAIPPPGALPSGVRQDVAIEEAAPAPAARTPGAQAPQPSQPSQPSQASQTEPAQDGETAAAPQPPADYRIEQSSITGDQSTTRDTLGTAAYAEAIARGIQHQETRAPLTIGIKAPWGAGKTSLMRMIRDRLEWPGLEPEDKPPDITLTPPAARKVATNRRKSAMRGAGDLGEVTNAAVLRKLRKHDSDSDGDGGEEVKAIPGRADPGRAFTPIPGLDMARWRPTVWFNPWMYQTGDQVWAGLANEIINQVTDRLTRREREHFWLQLNLRRVDEQAVRRKIYGLVLGYLVPYAVFGLVLMTGGIVLLAAGRTGWLGGSLAAAGPAALLAGAVAALQALRSRVGAGLSGLIQPATAARQFTANELSGAYQELVTNPDYRAQSGHLYLVQTDVKRVLDLVATTAKPLVIFVDDLDRCSPSTVVQVIEAINIFVAGDFTKCVFVIAMEPEMVAAHIEAAYADLATKLAQTSGRAAPAIGLGWRFLEKIVQLPLALPALEPKSSTAFIASLFPARAARDAGGAGRPVRDAAAAEPAADRDGRSAGEALATASLSEAINIGESVRPDGAAGQRVREAVERQLTADDPEVKRVIEYAAGFLNRNPREIKRFVNLFRFYTMIYAERKLASLPAPGSLYEVAKLAVLGIRWPSLLGTLALTAGGEQTIFELLEGRPMTDEDSVKAELAAAGLSDAMITYLLGPEFASFMRAAPTVGSGARGYI